MIQLNKLKSVHNDQVQLKYNSLGNKHVTEAVQLSSLSLRFGMILMTSDYSL